MPNKRHLRYFDELNTNFVAIVMAIFVHQVLVIIFHHYTNNFAQLNFNQKQNRIFYLPYFIS